MKYSVGGYQGRQGTEMLWKKVYDYIADTYEEEGIESIYVNGDGTEWIKAGKGQF